jgi:hypothetical protein
VGGGSGLPLSLGCCVHGPTQMFDRLKVIRFLRHWIVMVFAVVSPDGPRQLPLGIERPKLLVCILCDI